MKDKTPKGPSKTIYCISSRVEKTGQLYGCFKIGPFLGHQSGTFANALRRTLLADTSRCILNAVQIEGVEHEYSSLIGIRESVIDILLNFEKLTFQNAQPLTKPQIGFVNASGPIILRAQHLHLPKGLKCVDPSQYLATLEIDGRLTLKLFFSPNWNQFVSLLERVDLSPKFSKIEKIRKREQNSKSPSGFILKSCSHSNMFHLLKKKRIGLKGPRGSAACDRAAKPEAVGLKGPPRGLAAAKPRRSLQKSPIRSAISTAKKKTQNKCGTSAGLLGQLQKKKIQFFLKQARASERSKSHNLGNSSSLSAPPKSYLFLKSSLCSVEKVHYTLQSRAYNTLKSEQELFFDYILLEVWTNGTRHPQKAVFKAINDILLDLYPYSLEQEKLKNLQFLKPRTLYWREKFLNLEISNFYFDLETSIFLKKNNIHRVLDFILFLKKRAPKGPSIPRELQESVQTFKYFLINQIGAFDKNL